MNTNLDCVKFVLFVSACCCFCSAFILATYSYFVIDRFSTDVTGVKETDETDPSIFLGTFYLFCRLICFMFLGPIVLTVPWFILTFLICCNGDWRHNDAN